MPIQKQARHEIINQTAEEQLKIILFRQQNIQL